MTGYDIKMQAEAYIDDSIDDLHAVAAINRAMGLLGDMLLIYDDAQMVVADGEERTWKALPADATNVREVTLSNGTNYTGWRQRDGLIWFDKPGTYHVYYRRMPRPLTNIHDETEIHPAWHQVFVTYLIGWWKLRDDDENPDGIRHMQQFETDALRVFNMLSRRRGPGNIRVIRHA